MLRLMSPGRRRPKFLRAGIAAIFGALVLGASLPTPAVAGPGANYPRTAANLTAEEQDIVRRMERYLNTITSLKARFVQVTEDGRYSEGKLYFQRPDKIRFEYAPPVPILIVANYDWVTYWDAELRQASKIPLSSTPLWILAREKISLSDKLTVTGVHRDAGVVRIGMVQTDDPDAGHVVMTFSMTPTSLRKWSITDTQGTTINVALFNAEKNVAIDPELFEFQDPTFLERND